MSYKNRYTPLLFILSFATLLRFYRLEAQSLWSDEGNSAAMVAQSWSDIAQRTAADIHPPFYYWLLKTWYLVWGDTEWALRALSAVLGVGLVYVTYQLGQSLFNRRVARLAACIAAFSPLQIYYAQEARMYMLLAVLSALTVWLAYTWRNTPLYLISYVIVTTLGFYTHYAYPLIFILAGFWLIWHSRTVTPLWLPVLCYLPWLPTAWHQLTTWPSEKVALPLTTIITTLTFGLSWPYSPMWAVLTMTGVIGAWVYPAPKKLFLLSTWLLLPVALTALLASPAFLKFLLVATPAWALLMAVALETLKPKGILIQAALLGVLLTSQTLSLYHYYTNPRYARDNYRGIAQFIQAVAHPDDAIILHAEGQQEIFRYYFRQATPPIYPLPRHRPLIEAETLTELQQIAQTSTQVYAVYWATQQADPSGLIETWLNQHLFKATDRWYGNVRLVSYASPKVNPSWHQVSQVWSAPLTLTQYSLFSPTMTNGDILQVALQWQLTPPLAPTYTLFVQVLDEARHVVGQRDLPFSACEACQVFTTTAGIFLEPGTPPGQHGVILGLYDSQTGQRLPLSAGGDFVELSPITLRARVWPDEAFHWHTSTHQPLGGLTLRGYDLYKMGHRSDPDTPLHGGDPISIVAYWQRTEPSLTSELTLNIVDWTGQPTPLQLTAPVAGVTYPLEEWQPHEIVRAQYDLFLTGLTPGLYQVQWHWQGQTATSRPFRVN